MKIKTSHTKPTITDVLRKIKLLIIIFLIISTTIISFLYGYQYHRDGNSLKYHPNILKNPIRTVVNYAEGVAARSEHIFIDIKHKDFQKLSYKREGALDEGLLISDQDDFVPAEIRLNGKTLKADIRLKGDFTTHLSGDKWSFRIKIKGDNTLFGMKRFSIHHPRERNYIYEWLYHNALKREDVLSLRYMFVKVTLNGKDLGIYALEEHFEKRLLEYNQRKEAPIIRFSERLFWKGNTFPGHFSDTEIYMGAEIDAFHSNKILGNPEFLSQFEKAASLLENFRSGKLKTTEVFDPVYLSKFLALSDLFGASHAIRWHNNRYYYNSITSKLEPIGFDADSGAHIASLIYYQSQRDYMKHPRTVFNDMLLLEMYIRELDRISQPQYLDQLFSDLDTELISNLKIIHREFPYFIFDNNFLYQNQEFIRGVLNPEKGLNVFFKGKSNNEIELQLGSIQSLPIEVLNVSLNNSIFQPVKNSVLPPKMPIETVKYHSYRFKIPENVSWPDKMVPDLKLDYKILGTEKVRQVTVLPWNFLDDSLIDNDFVRQPANIYDFEFLSVDETTKTITFKTGKLNLTENLVIPAGYTVIAYEGLHLDFTNSAKILTYSPLKFTGSIESPILIYSSDATGQGIFIMTAEQESLLEYTIFNNLSNPSHNRWELTGAVTFYKSPVKIYNCTFSRSRSEDALNIIRSTFAIENTLFTQNGSDAFDADFSQGEITNSSFINSGNDAVDISGSYVVLNNTNIDKAGDKGLSAGEASQLRASRTEIKNAEIAVASKDNSFVDIMGINIENSKIGYAAYQKKPEFGPGRINIRGHVIKYVEIPFLVESSSIVSVEGEKVESDRQNVEGILYGVEYGKSSE